MSSVKVNFEVSREVVTTLLFIIAIVILGLKGLEEAVGGLLVVLLTLHIIFFMFKD